VIGWLVLAGLLGALLSPAAVWADAFTSWTPGSGGELDPSFDGYIDVPSMNATVPTGSFYVSGWFVDKTAQGWAGADDVQIWLGTMDGGGALVVRAKFAQSRPDVATALGNPYWAASGFNAFVPANALPVGARTLSVYAHTPGKGWWYKQVQLNLSASGTAALGLASSPPPILVIEKPPSGEGVATNPLYSTISGYALDKAGAATGVVGINRVSVYVDNTRENGGRYLGEAVLGQSSQTAKAAYGSTFSNAGWRLDFKPTNFRAGSHTLYIYARSVLTGKEDLETSTFRVVEN
jgi:hypothetical protein